MPSAGFGASDPLSAMKTGSSMDPLGGHNLDPLSGNPLGTAIPKKNSLGNAGFDPLSGGASKSVNAGASFDPMNPLAGPSKSTAAAKPAAPKFEALLPLPADCQNKFIEKLCGQTALQPETLDKVTNVSQKK